MLTCKKYDLILMHKERNRGTRILGNHALGSWIVVVIIVVVQSVEPKKNCKTDQNSERKRRKERPPML